MPLDVNQWDHCYRQLVDEANRFFRSIDEIVRKIEADGNGAEEQVKEWKRRLERSWPAANFDSLINDAKHRLGQDALNTVRFRQRHVERWRKQIDLLEDGFDFSYEATRLIEKSLMDEDSIVLPITGRDVIDALRITPGPRVGHFLEEARKRFESQPCSKDELLAYLKDV